jgi:hypothetical protein
MSAVTGRGGGALGPGQRRAVRCVSPLAAVAGRETVNRGEEVVSTGVA